MNSYNYMIRNYKTSDSPAGDLARDMARDSEHFPRNRACKFKGWHDIIHNHLVRSGACDACLETFKECWEEYVRCEKKKLKRN